MTRCIRKMVFFGLCVVVAFFAASPIQGQDKVKLTGPELDNLLLEPGVISFGINHQNNSVWIAEAFVNGKRSLYWRSLENPIVWGTDIGTTRIVDDQLCEQWSWGSEKCLEVYRVGENKYQSSFRNDLWSTFYKGQTAYETRKDKVKLTGAELKERESKPGVFVGVNQRSKSVWIIVSPSSGKRELYWRSLRTEGWSGSWTGIARIVGDQQCIKWTFGLERYYDVYRIGEDQYETWLNGGLDSVYYRLK